MHACSGRENASEDINEVRNFSDGVWGKTYPEMKKKTFIKVE